MGNWGAHTPQQGSQTALETALLSPWSDRQPSSFQLSLASSQAFPLALNTCGTQSECESPSRPFASDDLGAGVRAGSHDKETDHRFLASPLLRGLADLASGFEAAGHAGLAPALARRVKCTERLVRRSDRTPVVSTPQLVRIRYPAGYLPLGRERKKTNEYGRRSHVRSVLLGAIISPRSWCRSCMCLCWLTPSAGRPPSIRIATEGLQRALRP